MSPAKRKRNYARELEQRNAKAQALGYSSYNALRRALEKGKVARSGEKIVAKADHRPLYKRAGFDTPQEYMAAQRENKEWIKKHAKSAVTKNPIKGFEKEYNTAFVQYPNSNKMLDMEHYLVDVTGIYTKAQFDRKYLNK